MEDEDEVPGISFSLLPELVESMHKWMITPSVSFSASQIKGKKKRQGKAEEEEEVEDKNNNRILQAKVTGLS